MIPSLNASGVPLALIYNFFPVDANLNALFFEIVFHVIANH